MSDRNASEPSALTFLFGPIISFLTGAVLVGGTVLIFDLVFGAIPKIVISLVGGFAVFVAWRVIRRLFWKDMPLPPRSSIPSRDKMQKM